MVSDSSDGVAIDEGGWMERCEELFDLALRESPERRERFVVEQVGEDMRLRDEVLSLLAHHEGAARLFQSEPAAVLGELEAPIPKQIGRYRCLARIGAGGMGIVYLAEQENPRRQVALKVLRQAVATAEVRRRFRYEGEILGRLQHPGIAQIHEAETLESSEGPLAFLVMEYVVGLPLVEYANQHRMSVRERIGLLLLVCDAVQHAHQRGVIHRDLKPQNILVGPGGQPKVLDFGIARVIDADFAVTQETAVGQIVGTLAYMSPEQASGRPERVDTRADVYALGGIAFELLAGVRPHDLEGLAFHAALEVLCETDAPRLGQGRPALRGDLETIVAKALEREPARRYGSVGHFAADLRAFLADEPISVHPPSTLYQWKRLARKHRLFVASVASIVAILSIAVFFTTRLAFQLREQRDLAWKEGLAARAAEQAATDRADEAAAIALFLGDVFAGGGPYVGRHDMSVSEALEFASREIAVRFAERPALAAKLHWRISSVFYSHGRLDAALREGRAALALRAAVQDVDPRLLAMSHADLGGMLQEQGRSDEAREHLEEALRLFEEHDAEDDPYYLTAMVNLGAHLLEVGEYQAAEPWMRRALEERQALYGPEHPYTLTALNNLATLLRRMGRLAEASPMIEENLEISRRVLGERHPNTITAIYNTADLLRELEHFEEAEELFLEAIELGELHLPAGHWLRGLYVSRYGELLLSLGRLEEARESLQEGYEILLQSLGEGHERTLRVAAALERL